MWVSWQKFKIRLLFKVQSYISQMCVYILPKTYVAVCASFFLCRRRRRCPVKFFMCYIWYNVRDFGTFRPTFRMAHKLNEPNFVSHVYKMFAYIVSIHFSSIANWTPTNTNPFRYYNQIPNGRTFSCAFLLLALSLSFSFQKADDASIAQRTSEQTK